RWSSCFGINYNSSDNDYRFPQTDQRNTNGEFEHMNINFNAGYLLNDTQVLRMYHQSFIGDRNLSGTLLAPGRSRYVDNHHRTQLEWGRFGKSTINKIKVARLHEAYTYYENKDSNTSTKGRVTTLLARYALDIELSDALRLNSFLEYNNFRGNGNNFGTPQRSDLALTAVLKHTVSRPFRYNLSLRQDISTDFSSPLVFAWNGSYDFGPLYKLQLNASRNFRTPTFNDLYWQPGGNPELQSEQSYQMDLGHRFAFGPISLDLNTYYISTRDMIRWLPNTEGLWSPSNVDNVRIYGAELALRTKKIILKKQEIELNANYGYTVSEDTATDQQLIYVPYHRGNASVAYRFHTMALFYQHLYNGPVSIIGGELKGYQVANAGLTYTPKTKGTFGYRLGLTLNNVFNTYYENIALRPMPNRNIQTQLLLYF
ncbi:MAG: TonB-dependent receptor plug domain-containing protein, partial [Flavobacteriaceae bacterium]